MERAFQSTRIWASVGGVLAVRLTCTPISSYSRWTSDSTVATLPHIVHQLRILSPLSSDVPGALEHKYSSPLNQMTVNTTWVMSHDSLKHYAEQVCQELTGQWNLSKRVGKGNSATVYKIRSYDETAALKIYEPRFFTGHNAAVEERRIFDQMTLKGHGHSHLIDFISADRVSDTYYLLMEYFPWDSLDEVIANIPISEVSPIISKIASAAQYLEERNFVHRDIKPANILISNDWQCVKLLDLGVMRPITTEKNLDETDQGYKLPFVATAQYSSPAYLFREGEPSETMWKALTFYQLGGVLHDLLMKYPLFHDQVRTGNRYRVAAAVLQTEPRIHAPDAPAYLVSLARNCLVKDDCRRLARVYWDRFIPDESPSLQDLRNRLGLVPTRNSQRNELSMSQQLQTRIDLLLDKGRDYLVELGHHVLRSEGFPNTRMKRYHDSPSLKRSITFRFQPQFATEPNIMMHFAIDILLQCETSENLDVSLASFLTIGNDSVPNEYESEFLWTASLETPAGDKEQMKELMADEFIRRYAAAEDRMHTEMDGRNHVLQITHRRS